MAAVGGGAGLNELWLSYDKEISKDTGMHVGEKASCETVIYPPGPGYGQAPRKKSLDW